MSWCNSRRIHRAHSGVVVIGHFSYLSSGFRLLFLFKSRKHSGRDLNRASDILISVQLWNR